MKAPTPNHINHTHTLPVSMNEPPPPPHTHTHHHHLHHHTPLTTHTPFPASSSFFGQVREELRCMICYEILREAKAVAEVSYPSVGELNG